MVNVPMGPSALGVTKCLLKGWLGLVKLGFQTFFLFRTPNICCVNSKPSLLFQIVEPRASHFRGNPRPASGSVPWPRPLEVDPPWTCPPL